MIKPMLAATLENNVPIPFPVLASPKLDGVRVLIENGTAISRNGKEIPNKFIQSIIGDFKYEGYDGEIVVGDPAGKDVFRNTTSGVMSVGGTPDFKFFVFDDYKAAGGYLERLNHVFDEEGSRVRTINTCWVNNEHELNTYEELCLDAGYEGVMLRSPRPHYKQGRSTLKEFGLVKLKRFCDGEAEIIGFEELMINQNEKTLESGGKPKRSNHKAGLIKSCKLGALIVRDLLTGIQFNIGSGFSDEERVCMWMDKPSGIVKYRYFPTGSKDKPRFPTFQGFRDPIDI